MDSYLNILSALSKLTVKKRTAVFVDPIVDIVCYGIGRIASCPIARYQFAFLLLLKEFLQVK